MADATTRRLRGRGTPWLAGPPVALLLAFFVLPFASVALLSARLGLAGAADVVTDGLFLEAAWRTVLLAGVVTVLCWLAGVAYALGLALAPSRLRAFLLLALLLSFWTSVVVRAYGWILLYQPNGALTELLRLVGLRDEPVDLLQTTVGMYPAMVHVMLPFMVLPLYAAVLRLDMTQLRAAQSLGAGPLRTLARVVLPQLRSATVAGVTLVFLLSLGFYVTPALLGGPSDFTLGTVIAHEFNQLFDFEAAAAMGAVLLLGVIVAYAAVNRLFGLERAWERP